MAQTLARVEALAHWLSHLRWSLALLIIAGLAASFTSTVFEGLAKGYVYPYKQVIEHAAFSLAGLLVAWLATFILTRTQPAKRWLRIAIPLAFVISLILVALVRLSPLGESVYGARRWLDIGPVTFQPSELLKVCIVLYLGQLLCWWRRQPRGEGELSYAELRRGVGAGPVPARDGSSKMRAGRAPAPTQVTPTEARFRDNWRTSLKLTELEAAEKLSRLERLLTPSKRGPFAWLQMSTGTEAGATRPLWPSLPPLCFLIILAAMGLTAIQPDLGTTGVILGVSVVTCLLAGTKARDLLVLLAILVGLGGTVMVVAPEFYNYAEERVQTWLDPLANDDDTAYQLTQGRGAVAVGGLLGRGFLKGEQKMNRLPLATKDFIYPVMVEELGSVGGVLILGLFLYLALCGMQLGLASRDPFNQTVIPALGFAVALQAFVNIGTTLGTLPLSGLPLPFLSNGGTSLLVSIFSIGLMYAFARTELLAGDKELAEVLG
jgi:cell division protein FtsW (lipid II flippase)